MLDPVARAHRAARDLPAPTDDESARAYETVLDALEQAADTPGLSDGARAEFLRDATTMRTKLLHYRNS